MGFDSILKADCPPLPVIPKPPDEATCWTSSCYIHTTCGPLIMISGAVPRP